MSGAWIGRLRRLRRVLRRRRIDGALPPHLRRLYGDLVRLRTRDALHGAAARVLTVRGRAGSDRSVVRVGGRRWHVASEVSCPARDLAHLHATAVFDALHAADLHPFLVSDGPGLTIGLELSERGPALDALASVFAAPGWYITVHRGRTVRLLGQRTRRRWRRHAVIATSWRIWSMRAAGPDVALGPTEAATVTFWERGELGRVERIGVRRHERFASSSPWTDEVVDGRCYPGRAALPVARALTRFDEPVDAVITWVDSGDPEWRRSFEEWSGRERAERGPHGPAAPIRYHSRDELRYALRSIWLHAGWFRRIFLVTHGQVPPWLADDDRVTVVAHHALFPHAWLPVFNSHAIEARLHHIPDLAEHFVYFNDDTFLGRPLMPEAFFDGNGLPRILLSEARVLEVEGPGAFGRDAAAHRSQGIVRTRYGGKEVAFVLQHAPFALRRSTLSELEDELNEGVTRTARNRFRHPDDLSLASSLAGLVAYATGRASVGALAIEYIPLESTRLGAHLERLRRGRSFDAFCLNQTELPPTDPARIDDRVARFLEAYFPVAAPWERVREASAQGSGGNGTVNTAGR